PSRRRCPPHDQCARAGHHGPGREMMLASTSEELRMDPATPHPDGAYRYLPAGGAYSAGVAAEAGHALIGLRLPEHAPLEDALALVDDELAARDLPATSLAALHLRIPEVMTAEEFGSFNERYLELLDRRGLLVDGASPIARTNVAPLFG